MREQREKAQNARARARERESRRLWFAPRAPQAIEYARNTINDLAAMPAALGGRMGTTGIGMMGNAMMPYARAMMPNSGWLAAGPARRRGP